jgi:hypothetical protein
MLPGQRYHAHAAWKEDFMYAKASPELTEQLHRADQEPVQAIFHLQAPEGPDAPLTDAETERIAHTLLERVAAKVGSQPMRSNLLRNLRTLIVEAHRDFVQSMLQEPEVASASASRTMESPLIKPVRKRPVE